MNQIKRSASVHLNNYSKDIKTATSIKALPAEAKCLKQCVLSNQRSNLAVEFERIQESTKVTLNFGEARLKIFSVFAFFKFKTQ